MLRAWTDPRNVGSAVSALIAAVALCALYWSLGYDVPVGTSLLGAVVGRMLIDAAGAAVEGRQ